MSFGAWQLLSDIDWLLLLLMNVLTIHKLECLCVHDLFKVLLAIIC